MRGNNNWRNKKMVQEMKKFLAHDWVKIFTIVVTLVGIALAGEHRVTVVERDDDSLFAITKQQEETLKLVQREISILTSNQNRAALLLDQIDRRHQLEDQIAIQELNKYRKGRE